MPTLLKSTYPNISKIALFVGVTGHREIIEEDIERIRADIRIKLKHIETVAKDVPLILLSGLAEGADQLVAEEALSRNWTVFAVFPMPFSSFLEDFSSDKRETLKHLRDRCSEVIEIPLAVEIDADITNPRDQQYRNQSIFIARQSQLVIALWDGVQVSTTGACGTAYVVELCRRGPPPIEGEMLAAPETTSLIHIPIRQKKEPDRKLHETKSTTTDRAFVDICRAFRLYNRAAIKLWKTNPKKLKESKDWIVPEGDVANLDFATQTLITDYACADRLAIDHQTTRDQVLRVASVATVLAAFAQATNGLFGQSSWMIVYGIAVGLAYGLYLILFKLPLYRSEDCYLEYRALAEALRVQVFWRVAGLSSVVAEHYLQLVKTEVGWVREALRSLWLNASVADLNRNVSLEVVHRFWIDDQIKFFVGTESEVVGGKSFKWKNLQKTLEFLANMAIACGVILVGTASVAVIWSIPADIKAAASAYSATFFLCGGVIKAYVAAMGYLDQAMSYEKMGAIFRAAKRVLEQGSERQQECLISLGKHALAENAEWLLQHRKNAFKPQS